MSIGTRIKECRKYLNMNQRDLSEKLSLTPRMISFYENDERVPPADILVRLSNTFGVSVDFLLELSIDYKGLNNLSIIEKELLNGFRLLPPDDQKELIEILKLKLLKIQTKENSKKTRA